MSENTQTLTTLSRTEAVILSAFIYQVDSWKNQYGEKADNIEIIYYPEDDGFDIINNEPNNGVLKRTRTTVFRADIVAWANAKLKELQGYTNENTVTAFACVYKNGEYGVAVEAVPTASLANVEPTDELDKQE